MPQIAPEWRAAADLTGASAWIAGQAILRLTAKAVSLACVEKSHVPPDKRPRTGERVDK